MDYLTALAIILACALGAGAISILLGRRIHIQARRNCHEVGIAVFLQVGVIYAGFLASLLVTIHMLDYPFEGSISISSKTISESIGVVTLERPAGPAD